MASSPSHRARAKQILTKVLIAMVLTALAPPIYQLLLTIAGGLTDGVMDVIKYNILPAGPEGILTKMIVAFAKAMPFPDPGAGLLSDDFLRAFDMAKILSAIVILSITGVFWMLAIIIVMFRYVIVVFLGVLFPLTLALYLFEFTRNPGRKILKATLVFIFAPFLMSIWLATGLALLPYATSSNNYYTALILLVLLSLMVSVSPLQLSGLLTVMGGIVTSIGQFIPSGWGTAMVAVGGIMQGKGASAIGGAALKYSGGKLLKGGKTLAMASIFGGKAAVAEAIKQPFKGAAGAIKRGVGAVSGAIGKGKGKGVMGGLVGTSAYKKAGRKVFGKGGRKAMARGAQRVATGAGKVAAAPFVGLGKAFSPKGIAGRWRNLGSSTKKAGKKLGSMARFGAMVAWGKISEKMTGGLVSAKPAQAKGEKPKGRGLKERWTAAKGKAGAAWDGTKSAFRGMGRSAASAWSGTKSAIGKSLGGGVLGGLWGRGIGGKIAAVALAPAIIGAKVGWAGMKAGWKGIAAAPGAIWTGIKRAGISIGQSVARSRLGRSVRGFRRARKKLGLAGAGLRAVLGKAEFKRYMGKKAAGKKLPLLGSLARRAAQKALGLTDNQVKALEKRGEGLTKRRALEKGRDKISGVINSAGKKDFDKKFDRLSDGDKKRLGEIAGISVTRPDGSIDPAKMRDLRAHLNGGLDSQGNLRTGLDDNGKKAWSYATNEHFDKAIDGVDKQYGLGAYAARMEDTNLSNRSLSEDAKTDSKEADQIRADAQSDTGEARTAGIERAQDLKAQNPAGINEPEATTLDRDFGIRTRGELAHMDKDQRDRIIASGKISEARIDELQQGAKRGIEREPTMREQFGLDRGLTKDQIADEKVRDESLRSAISNAGGRKQPMKEDFLTAVEEERG